MEYACQVWSSYQKGHITILDSAQWFALKVCSTICPIEKIQYPHTRGKKT